MVNDKVWRCVMAIAFGGYAQRQLKRVLLTDFVCCNNKINISVIPYHQIPFGHSIQTVAQLDPGI